MMRGIKKGFTFTLILLLIAMVLIGKAYYTRSGDMFFYIYGLTVSGFIFLTFFVAQYKYADPAEVVKKRKLNSGKKKPFVSCICAVYNDQYVIKSCVESFLNSTYTNKEVIVVNDASTDKSWEVLQKYKNHPQVRLINLKKNVGKKKALAEGVKVAKGEIYAFTDSDSVVAPDALEKIISVFVCDPMIGAVSGHGRALNADNNLLTRIQDAWYETSFSVEKAYESSYGCVTCVSGPLAVFRKEAIFNYIPAWENDSFLGKEFRFATDRQLTGYVLGSKQIEKKLKAKYKDSFFVKSQNYEPKDWRVVYCNSAKVWTNVPDTFGKMIKQHVRWKKSFIRNLFFTGSFYWRKPMPASLKYYAGCLITIAGPFIVARHLIYLPSQGSPMAAIFYLGGILFIGSLYALAFKIDNPDSKMWVYRPLMSIMSTLILSWLIFYSALTIRNPIWHRG